MPTNNFIVSTLPDYVANNREVLLKNFGLLGNGTRSRIGLQTGIKKQAELNFLEIAPVLQDGANCELEPQGSATLTDRIINVKWIETYFTICPKKLIGKWAEYLVRANANAENLPFEQYIVDGLMNSINEKIENLIWQGDTTSTDADLKWIDGFAKVIETDGVQATVTGATVLAKLQSLYASIPAEALKRGAEIYVSPAKYRAFLMDLVNANLFHYPSAESGTFPKEFFLPGADVKVVMTDGLGTSAKAYATFPANLVYGTDMENDEEDVKIKYDDIKEIFHVKALWASGVQVAFPGLAVYATI